jgi:hypothetical protein
MSDNIILGNQQQPAAAGHAWELGGIVLPPAFHLKKKVPLTKLSAGSGRGRARRTRPLPIASSSWRRQLSIPIHFCGDLCRRWWVAQEVVHAACHQVFLCSAHSMCSPRHPSCTVQVHCFASGILRCLDFSRCSPSPFNPCCSYNLSKQIGLEQTSTSFLLGWTPLHLPDAAAAHNMYLITSRKTRSLLLKLISKPTMFVQYMFPFHLPCS